MVSVLSWTSAEGARLVDALGVQQRSCGNGARRNRGVAARRGGSRSAALSLGKVAGLVDRSRRREAAADQRARRGDPADALWAIVEGAAYVSLPDGTTVALGEGDVLQVLSNYNGDVTGTIVEADKPVQVIGGHKCTNVPANISACDHLEESMFPIETLAKEYVVVPPVQVPNDTKDKGQIVRVIASEANTTLTFTPDQPVGKVLVNAGDFVEIPTTIAKFVVSADKKILVSQYMVGQDGGYGTSDPAMLVTVNPQQWRKNYLFHAATNWQANYVDILAPMGAVVTVDAVNVANWQPVAATNYQVAHVKLSNANGGNHSPFSHVVTR